VLNVVLFQPEIPPNTGNIIRLCSNTGCTLHLIEPLGFSMDDKNLRRAGLDYHEYSVVKTWQSWATFMETCRPRRIFAFSTKGTSCYSKCQFEEGDYLLFGPETTGLPPDLRQSSEITQVLRLPMLETSRSLNLSNTVAIAVYEAWRQLEFRGARKEGA
jgi:tRNA (cytidine/uridine-2'-O-)-methyltransferase